MLNKYLKRSVWRLALRYDIYIYIYIYMSLGFKRLRRHKTTFQWEDVDWIHLVEGTENWLALVNTVMNFRVMENGRNLARCLV